jgi:hypothetical protein
MIKSNHRGQFNKGFFILGLRTRAHVLEEYNAARTAKLKILEAQQAGIGDKALLRAKLAEVNAEIRRLAVEYDRLGGDGGIARNVGILQRS